jgi:nucleoside-diphosphate-sugar epimerase
MPWPAEGRLRRSASSPPPDGGLSELVPRPLAGQTVLVTGSTGFIGRPVCRGLLEAGAIVRGASRAGGQHPVRGTARVQVADQLDRQAVRAAVTGVDAIVHLAARVHVMRETAADPLAEFRRANVETTALLAEEAAAAGVRQLILASSVKAVGEGNSVAWTEDTPPAPVDPYGVSKLEAERLMREVASSQGIGTVVLRLPLVYGPGVKGNMLRLFTLVDRGVPLPFGSVANRRSLLYVGNLVAAVRAVLEHPHEGSETFFVSDGRDLSLPTLIRMIGDALGKPSRLFPVPPGLLRRILPAAEADRLIGSLTVDGSRLSRMTGYRRPHSVEEGLRATAEWYRTTNAHRTNPGARA